jgi:hypothetical protein
MAGDGATHWERKALEKVERQRSIDAAVKDGTLTIRKLTPADVDALERAIARRVYDGREYALEDRRSNTSANDETNGETPYRGKMADTPLASERVPPDSVAVVGTGIDAGE